MNRPENSGNDEPTNVEARRAYVNAAHTVHAIIQALQDRHGWIRVNAVAALVKIGVPAVPVLIEALQDTNKDVRRGVAEVLGKIGAPSAVPALIPALTDKTEQVRRSSALALGQIGQASAVPALVAALQDENRRVRENAGEALGRIGDVSAVPALVQALKDRESDVRYNVANALGKIGDSDTLPPKILADARLSAKERTELLDKLRRARYQKFGELYRYTFPDTRTLCRAVFDAGDADARAGAQEVLRWLDEGDILVRPSQRSAAGDAHELLRAARDQTPESQPETLLRGAGEPDGNVGPPPQRPTLWEQLIGKKQGS